MNKKLAAALSILALVVSMLPQIVWAARPNKVIFSEVKLGGLVEGQPTEFIEIYNDSDLVIDLIDWTLEYAKPSAVIPDCSVLRWNETDSSSNVREITLSGVIQPRGRAVVETSLTDNIGGSLRLTNAERVIQDLVGWGSETSQPPCVEDQAAPTPPKGKSLKRLFDEDGYPVDTDNNAANFMVSQFSSPESTPPLTEDQAQSEIDVCPNIAGVQSALPPGFNLEAGQCKVIAEQPQPLCVGIEISEIVPNPAGSDTGREFIELYNSTAEPIAVDGCILKVGSSQKTLSGTIGSGYTAIYGLTLPNTSGASVELITPTTEQVVMYPANMADDESWSLIDGVWQLTQQPTPGGENILAIAVGGKGASDTAVAPEPCPAGKYRSAETNRCRNIEDEDGLKPCAPGQVRNPETNRCRSVTAASLTSLKPCDPGQERNPETNRCRKVAGTSSELTACPEGQERNPETNRCRKVSGVSSASTPVSNIAAATTTPRVSYSILGVVAVLTLGYGVYEYRGDIANKLNTIRVRVKAK